jgi:MATE family, multidrug efflux pump
MSFSTCLLGFVERLWLSSYSLSTLEAALNGLNLLRVFQLPCLSLVMMAQAFVGYHHGANERHLIGPCIWQMIWFSLLSSCLVIPLGFYTYETVLKSLEMAELTRPYFLILIFGNFLFPLGGALSCFYLGRGKALFIALLVIGFHIVTGGLDYLLIFGIPSWLPSLGLKGAAIATVAGQALFCLVLLRLFLSKSDRLQFRSDQWMFHLKTFWHYIAPSMPRALGRLSLFAVWAANSFVMTSKGGHHLLVLSIGGTLSLFLAFLGDGVLQALVVTISHALGATNHRFIRKLLQAGLICVLLIGAILMLPLIIFAEQTLSLFHLTQATLLSLKATLFWVWFHTTVYLINTVPLSVLLALKDTPFLLFSNLLTWITGFLPVYLGINHFKLSADLFWLLASSAMIISTMLYTWRILQKRWLVPREPSVAG